MDMYLKKADVSASSEVSVAQTTFDLTAWAENLRGSQREQSGTTLGKREPQLEPISTKTEATPSNTDLSSVPSLKSGSPGLKNNSNRSSVPVSSARESLGSHHPSTLNPGADKPGRSFSGTAGSSTRTQTPHGVRHREKRTSNPNRSSLDTHRSDHSSFALPMASPDTNKGQSDLSGFKVASPLAQSHSLKSQQDMQNSFPEKKSPLRTISAPPLASSSGENHCDVTQPAINQAGKKNPKKDDSSSQQKHFYFILTTIFFLFRNATGFFRANCGYDTIQLQTINVSTHSLLSKPDHSS